MLKITHLKKKLANSILIFIGFVITSPQANAQSDKCVRVDQIGKWEVLDSDKTIIYDSQGNSIAFIVFSSGGLKKSGESFRFFSSSICVRDRVQLSRGMDTIFSIEQIRK